MSILPPGKNVALYALKIATRLRSCPLTFVIASTGPPALPGKPVTFANDKRCQFGLTARGSAPVNFVKRLALRAHLWPGEALAERL